MAGAMDLGLDDDELSTCVACGLCLPHCPTFRATGEEALSPRGRIDAMRAVQWRGAPADDEFVHFMETCVQCRGCEPACPSGVPFGRLMERTREALAEERLITPRWQRLAFSVLGRHRLLLAGSTLLALAQRVRLVPARLGLPRLPLRRGRRPVDTGTDVWLFTGCVMDAWLRETHRATAEVIDGRRRDVSRCRGAEATAAARSTCTPGSTTPARRLARRVMASMPGDAPIVVNSAGCGAALKDYGHLLGTAEAAAFAARVVDVHEWLAPRLDRLVGRPPPRQGHRAGPVPPAPRAARPHARSARCSPASPTWSSSTTTGCAAAPAAPTRRCSRSSPARSANASSAPSAAPRQRSGATVVASANPGCAMHLAAAGVTVRHPIDLAGRGHSMRSGR